MPDLINLKCAPCEGETKPLNRQEASRYLENLAGWALTEDARGIFYSIQTKNFLKAVEVINKIAEIAEKDSHHPDLHLTNYRGLRIDLTTHAIAGLSKNDFIVAAKISAWINQQKDLKHVQN